MSVGDGQHPAMRTPAVSRADAEGGLGRSSFLEPRLAQSRAGGQAGPPRVLLLGWATRIDSGSWSTHAIRVTCTGSCGVSNKANDAAWVAEEDYFNSSLSLADKATAPTSFEGPFGKIVHQVRAAIHTPRFSKDHKCSLVFYILSPLNLNSIPDIEQPNVASATKKFSYKLVKTGSVVLTASTDLRGYVVGQALQLHADIENQSGKDTSPVVASLLQKVSYKAKRWIHDVRTIAEVEGAGVKAWRRAQWHEQILVPALPQSALPGCSLIHIDYYLQVSLKAPEATVTLPVFIGNIAVNHAPLSPRPGPGLPPWAPPLVVPSAPPQEEAEAAAGGPHFLDPVSLSTKSHSQQQPLLATLGSVPGAPEPCPQDGSPASYPLRPPLCISTGATVPYFAEGSGGPVPTTSTLILPPEYSSWGYPYGESRARAWQGGDARSPMQTLLSPRRGPTVL
ncbi:PREDICTED: arrestin domain-containing protein 1 isoform X3 [Cercocebus atys]|uniref:arrestin domain-containing protein 1 isoform X3 n=1 Tax=Cercocebus atys TaxID=9531 RepID=UPI0005F3CD0B|nr:PREDICTED: arrestin domain-containing protein 1 isoform X3 [Cercocebus atys]